MVAMQKKPETWNNAATPPVILSIAGSDSGGGAGIQADLKTITVLGGFGVSVLSALTAQNGAGVRGVYDIEPEFVLLQLAAVREGFFVRAAKTGMLANAACIHAVADALREKDFPLVVDPVCVSGSGHRLLREDAEDALRQRMLPLADLLTPNRPEAELLAGMRINAIEDMEKAVERLHALGAKAVLLKGGHFDAYAGGEQMPDWLGIPGEPLLALPHPRIETENTHGTGCTLSAAIAFGLGMGLLLRQAVEQAQAFLTRALASGFNPGIGAGPPNFMGGVRA